MYMAPKARDRGIARALLLEALALARSAPGVLQANLSVNASNLGPIKLYESVGFEVFGREPRALLVEDAPNDELHMCLRFTDR